MEAVLKGARPDLHQLHQTALSTRRGGEPSDLCSGTRPATGGGRGRAGLMELGDRWIVSQGHNGSLLHVFREVTVGEM